MKKTLFISFLFCFNLVFSQGEANIWYFGGNAGLDFNSGSPVAITNGQLTTNEGCATISNSLGQLLFYTDGIAVYDKLHQVMPNGTGLLGHPSSTQSAIIVPNPVNTNIYYIFTTDFEGYSNGLNYSVVDITLNGGLGDVTSQKNALLKTPICEKLTAIKNEAANEYWVVSHGYGNNEFCSYRVTAAGVIISQINHSSLSKLEGTKFKIDTLNYAKANYDRLSNEIGWKNTPNGKAWLKIYKSTFNF